MDSKWVVHMSPKINGSGENAELKEKWSNWFHICILRDRKDQQESEKIHYEIFKSHHLDQVEFDMI